MSLPTKASRLVKSAATWVIGSVAILLFLALVGFSLFGTYRAFDREGVGMGLWAVFFPPYSVYKGLAWFWEEPEWEAAMDSRAGQIALMLSTGQNADAGTLLSIKEHTPQIRSWVNSLPLEEKDKLKQACSAYTGAVRERALEVNGSLVRLEGFPTELGEKTRALAEKVFTVPALKRQWDRMNQTEFSAGYVIRNWAANFPFAMDYDPGTGRVKNTGTLTVESLKKSPAYRDYLRRYAEVEKRYQAKLNNHSGNLLEDLFGS